MQKFKVYHAGSQNSPIRIRFYYKLGGLFQETGKEGISHLLEHIIATTLSKHYKRCYAYTTKEFISKF